MRNTHTELTISHFYDWLPFRNRCFCPFKSVFVFSVFSPKNCHNTSKARRKLKMTKQQIKRFDRAKSPTFHDRELRSISKCVQTTNAERLISLRKRTFCLSKKKRMILFRVLHTEENFKIVGRKSTNISCNMQHANKYPLERIV